MGQTTVPDAGLKFIQNIAVPGWTTTGATQANFDLFAFNPQTRIMYVADRTNKAITAIDTRTNSTIGVLPIPSLGSTNGVLIAPELQQLVVTDGKANVYVYDLALPGNGPDVYVIPGVSGGTDALDYDPLNHSVYVINGARNYMTGINLLTKSVTTQLPLPGTPELMRFNPVDGLIYQVLTDGDSGPGVVAYDPVANKIAHYYATPNCVPHGIEIDAPTNTALLGCGTTQAQVLMSLKDGSTVKTFPDVTGSDLLAYSTNNRRFYTGGGSNKSTTTACPADGTTSAKNFPIMGVIAPQGSGSLVGVTCVGRTSHGLGVDPIQNFVYVGSRQYPVDPNDPSTGAAGVLVFYDPSPAQPLTVNTQATVASIGGNLAKGTVLMRLQGRKVRLDANLTGLTGMAGLVNVTTTVGNEVVECSINYTTGAAVCNGNLLGDPLIGGVAMVAVDGVPVASGPIAALAAQ